MATLSIQEHVPLAPLTTIGVGGTARFFARVRSERELQEAVFFQKRHNLPLFILGGGSNLIVRDEGFPGMVLHLEIPGDIRMDGQGGRIRCAVPAGVPWDDFVLLACKQNLSGIECLAGIPGLTGGTPVQNVGAYGQEVAQTIKTVRVYDLESLSFRELTANDCHFSYRSSRFNTQHVGRFVVTCVTFELTRSERTVLTYAELCDRFPEHSPTPMQVYDAVREIRKGKGMLLSTTDPNSRSAGSFFKNPVISEEHFLNIFQLKGISESIPHWKLEGSFAMPQVKLAAAWLVQMAGFQKGFVDGKVGISRSHALAIINLGGARFADIAHLRDQIRSTVAEKFQIELEQEPVELGPDSVARSYRTASRPTFGSLDWTSEESSQLRN